MKTIKIIGAFIFILSITLALLFNQTSEQNKLHNNYLNTINEQKAFTQEISKNIFYIYRNKNSSTDQLDKAIKDFINHMNSVEQTDVKSQKIITLWNKFYLHVQNFRDKIKIKAPYSSITLEETVQDIYNTNLKLVVEFDKLIKADKITFERKVSMYKYTQYTLYVILVLLLLFIFTQLRSIVEFIQKFLSASKRIITNSSIEDLKPIELNNKNVDISKATDNFNTLVQKINNSVEHSSDSIEYTISSLKALEQHIQELVELIYEMNDETTDKELTKKEDAVIQSLEELCSTARALKNLKDDLDNLISHSKSN